MKTAVLFTLFISMGIAFAVYTENSDGHPGCKTELELTQKLWRNNFDPTMYFICKTRNQAAEIAVCEQEHLFDSTKLVCVPLDDWEWTEPIDPPSFAETE